MVKISIRAISQKNTGVLTTAANQKPSCSIKTRNLRQQNRSSNYSRQPQRTVYTTPAHCPTAGQTNRSRRLTMIVAQQSTQPFLAFDVSRDGWLGFLGKQQHITLALVVALLVVVHRVVVQSPSQAALTEQNQLAQTLLFDRAHPPLCVGVQVGAACW